MKKQGNVVRKTKGILILAVVLLLTSGWLLTVYSLAVDKDLQAQTALIQSAEEFLEDKLYIRAVSKYKEALTGYQTERNGEIEKGLLDIYKTGGMWEDYYDLLESRVSGERAGAEEYMILAEHFVEEENPGNGVVYLEQGRRLCPDNEELISMDESLRYEYVAADTAFQMLGIYTEDDMIPAFDGEKWGYILKNGRTAIAFQYEEATRFSGEYAVVKLDGVYTLIDKNGYWNAVDKNGLDQVASICGKRIVGVKDGKYGIYTNTFQPVSQESYEGAYLSGNGYAFVKKGGKWALLDESMEQVTDFVFEDVVPNSRQEVFYKDYGVVADQSGYYLVRPDGEAWFDARFAAAKGIESGLVAVADEEGRWGFCDETGAVIVDFQYEDGLSFSSRLGAVRYAGKWGYINRYNTMVVGNDYKAAWPFAGDTAVVMDQKGNCGVLTLKYFDIYMGQ